MLSPGSVLQNRYRIIQRIGGGGMGTVYLADDTRLRGRRCAVKAMSLAQLPPADIAWATQAFRQEAQILARLNHPCLTPVTDFFDEGDSFYLVMDLVEGETLEARLQRASGGQLPQQEALNIVRQLCDVLAYLHGQSPPVVFRDLKPSNVMITSHSEVKLIDFGIARFFKPGQTRDTANLGTPGYAAPEQYGGRSQSDPRSDIYSLGVLLHQMLTGHDPTTTPFNLPSARSVNPAIPVTFEMVIQRATHVQQDQRFQDVREFCRALSSSLLPTTRLLGRVPINTVATRIGLIGLATLAILALIYLRTRGTALPSPTDTPNPPAVVAGVGESATSTPASVKPPTLTPARASPPTDTPKPTNTPVPTVCPDASPYGLNTTQLSRLGCPAQGWVSSRNIVIQQFSGGVMVIFAKANNTFDNKGGGFIYALANDGHAWRITDSFVETSSNPDDWYACERRPGQRPEDSGIPWRGFGKAWCEYPEVRASLGNVRSAEQLSSASFQSYESGRAFQVFDWKSFQGWDTNHVYAVYLSSTEGSFIPGAWE